LRFPAVERFIGEIIRVERGTRVMRVTVTATMHHPPEVVFRTAASPEKELEWDPGTLTVEKLTDGPLGKGSRYRGKFKGFGTIEYEFVEFDEPRRFVHQARIAIGTFQHRFTFEPVSGGTRLTQEGELWPTVLGWIASPVVKSMLGKRFRLIAAQVDRYLQLKNAG
jgi:uncharacterized protein YndB with AHSA1/START domain